MAKKNRVPFVPRPFEGLPGEVDLVAMREIVPAASAPARLTEEFGGDDILLVTVLPLDRPAMRRKDGLLMIAMRGAGASGDPSRDIAWAALAAKDLEDGDLLAPLGALEAGPRLQDILDLTVPWQVTVHEGYEYWLPEGDRDADVQAALEEANTGIFPTVKLEAAEGAYWCRMGAREFLRWGQSVDEERLLDALARLHARRESAIEEGTKLLGAFRACGLQIPVWEMVAGTEPDELEKPVAAFAPKLAAALADESPLTADERRARAGLVSRQVTIR
ncbi:DUF5926 family protein [Demequina capsici]|uniref:DUF5926 family protein n=1 Tax=Demequina capsici TaxID=3075620 RepID=A0AA96J9P3_9MICO|nr:MULTISPECIES: DUF5926 family protein [unclassified Demequina]WNM24643.1 DUF5926 family protein [Demequina sp. OYTSA14]WNM27492.1 DUF5926 family protein [Demequina sp. PMTSA13]